jgi:hypothetical protein
MKRLSTKLFVVLALALAVGLAAGASPYASRSPDGLERVAEDQGFFDSGSLHRVQERSPIPDYAFPAVGDPRLATGLAGFVGTLAVAALAIGIGAVIRRRTTPASRPAR